MSEWQAGTGNQALDISVLLAAPCHSPVLPMTECLTVHALGGPGLWTGNRDILQGHAGTHTHSHTHTNAYSPPNRHNSIHTHTQSPFSSHSP